MIYLLKKPNLSVDASGQDKAGMHGWINNKTNPNQTFNIINIAPSSPKQYAKINVGEALYGIDRGDGYGDYINSPGGNYFMQMNSNGNLFINSYNNDKNKVSPIYETKTVGTPNNTYLTLQSDGNLVLYDLAQNNKALWSSGTNGLNNIAYVGLDDRTGCLYAYDKNNNVLRNLTSNNPDFSVLTGQYPEKFYIQNVNTTSCLDSGGNNYHVYLGGCGASDGVGNDYQLWQYDNTNHYLQNMHFPGNCYSDNGSNSDSNRSNYSKCNVNDVNQLTYYDPVTKQFIMYKKNICLYNNGGAGTDQNQGVQSAPCDGLTNKQWNIVNINAPSANGQTKIFIGQALYGLDNNWGGYIDSPNRKYYLQIMPTGSYCIGKYSDYSHVFEAKLSATPSKASNVYLILESNGSLTLFDKSNRNNLYNTGSLNNVAYVALDDRTGCLYAYDSNNNPLKNLTSKYPDWSNLQTQYPSTFNIKVDNTYCLDDFYTDSNGYKKYYITPCDGSKQSQKYTYDFTNKVIKNVYTNNCIDDGGGGASNKVHDYQCNGSNANQNIYYDPVIKKLLLFNKTNTCINSNMDSGNGYHGEGNNSGSQGILGIFSSDCSDDKNHSWGF
jgi:hypothetical protein